MLSLCVDFDHENGGIPKKKEKMFLGARVDSKKLIN